jgi:4-amino-4-deoxy-L-arabinose transferase-like glycosyltransferase
MSDIAGPTEAAARGPSTAVAAAGTSFRWRRRIAIGGAVIVLGWSIVELASLAVVHTTGPELYGVLVAALAVAAGVGTLILLRSSERRLWATVALLALWAVVVLGGLAGVVAHIVGPVAGHGPVDTRPRPIAAPLIFTAFGLVGSAALWFGQRRPGARDTISRKE